MRTNQGHKRSFFYFVHIVLPIAFGFCIYLFFRDATLMTAWLKRTLSISKVFIPDSVFSVFALFYFPDFLWAYSLTFAIALVLPSASTRHIPILILSGGVEFAVEMLQKIGIINGTFDFLDFLVEVAASTLALRLIIQFERRKNEEDS